MNTRFITSTTLAAVFLLLSLAPAFAASPATQACDGSSRYIGKGPQGGDVYSTCSVRVLRTAMTTSGHIVTTQTVSYYIYQQLGGILVWKFGLSETWTGDHTANTILYYQSTPTPILYAVLGYGYILYTDSASQVASNRVLAADYGAIWFGWPWNVTYEAANLNCYANGTAQGWS